MVRPRREPYDASNDGSPTSSTAACVNDAITHAVTGPGGQMGAATDSSAADSNPNVDASEKSLPGPASLEASPAATGPFFVPLPTPVTAPTRSRRQARFA